MRGSLDDNHALLALVSAVLGACIVPDLVLTEVRSGIAVTVATQRVEPSRSIHAVS